MCLVRSFQLLAGNSVYSLILISEVEGSGCQKVVLSDCTLLTNLAPENNKSNVITSWAGEEQFSFYLLLAQVDFLN